MAVHLPKGTRDLLPETMLHRRQVIATVQEVFGRFGFAPMETPAFERIETLTGKYGDEGEKLMYRILRRGEHGERGEVDLALRYDLTVPLARVVAMNPGLPMPFKRFQIQPVWRADRPQKGRFREFYQCDVDTVGTTDLSADAECLAVVHTALRALGFEQFTIRLNHRRILRSIVAAMGASDREASVLTAIDKLDKIGRAGVEAELAERGVAPDGIARLWTLLAVRGEESLDFLARALDDEGRLGVDELRRVAAYARAMGVRDAHLAIDPTLARGLDYYTGTVYETRLDARPEFGSVCSGGRYDDLAGFYTKSKLPGVGISIGATRLFAALLEAGLLKAGESTVKVLVTRLDDTLGDDYLRLAARLRAANVPTEVYAEAARMKKQLAYADKAAIPFAVIMGGDEHARGVAQLKDLRSGEQWEVSRDDLAGAVRERLDRR